jgi:hypothetical protein
VGAVGRGPIEAGGLDGGRHRLEPPARPALGRIAGSAARRRADPGAGGQTGGASRRRPTRALAHPANGLHARITAAPAAPRSATEHDEDVLTTEPATATTTAATATAAATAAPS